MPIATFQSTLPARGATRRHRRSGRVARACFNPRSRAGSDRRRVATPACGRLFRSTLPRGERRIVAARMPGVDSVSIHAPARGATPCDMSPAVSIHAPARGATVASACPSFDPRSRAGSDACAASRRCHRRTVSIHAPARGATRRARAVDRRSACFDPRSRAGSDRGSRRQSQPPMQFRSTLPRGERPQRLRTSAPFAQCFDPRSRAGSEFRAKADSHSDAMRTLIPTEAGQ